MGIFDSAREQAEKVRDEHGGIPEGIGDSSLDHAPAAASDGTVDEPTEGTDSDRDAAAEQVGIESPGVPDTAGAAAGPTQAVTSGSGPAPAAGRYEAHAGLADSVAESEDAAQSGWSVGQREPAAGAEGGEGDEGDRPEAVDLAEEYGLTPGSSDVMDPGQDNGLNS